MKALAFRSINALCDGGNQIDRSCDMPTLRLYYVYTAPRDKTLRRSLCQHKEDGVIFPQASRYALSLSIQVGHIVAGLMRSAINYCTMFALILRTCVIVWNDASVERSGMTRARNICKDDMSSDRGREAVLRQHARLEFRRCHSLAAAALVKRRLGRANHDIFPR